MRESLLTVADGMGADLPVRRGISGRATVRARDGQDAGGNFTGARMRSEGAQAWGYASQGGAGGHTLASPAFGDPGARKPAPNARADWPAKTALLFGWGRSEDLLPAAWLRLGFGLGGFLGFFPAFVFVSHGGKFATKPRASKSPRRRFSMFLPDPQGEIAGRTAVPHRTYQYARSVQQASLIAWNEQGPRRCAVRRSGLVVMDGRCRKSLAKAVVLEAQQ